MRLEFSRNKKELKEDGNKWDHPAKRVEIRKNWKLMKGFRALAVCCRNKKELKDVNSFVIIRYHLVEIRKNWKFFNILSP